MISISLDPLTGLAKLLSSTTIKTGSDTPVTLVFTSAPGTVSSIKLALGAPDSNPVVLAFTEDFSEENETTQTALLDTNDTRLLAFMSNKGPQSVNLELLCVINGEVLRAPNVALTVQPHLIRPGDASEGGPTYYSESEADAKFALKTVAAKYRFKPDGSFQLWNADQSKWHTVGLAGAAGAEVLTIAAGE